MELSNKTLKGIVKSINKQCGLSQGKMARRFQVHQSTISRYLPNVPQARPIESIWTLLKRKLYENNWQANDLDALVRRINQKAKELDQKILQAMIEGVRKKLWAM